jgi:hypothetical protein
MIRSISTVNVIDFGSLAISNINQLVSFPDTPEGVAAAQMVFKDWVTDAAGDNTPSEDDLEDALDNGIFEVGEGAIVLTHSTIGSSEYPTE